VFMKRSDVGESAQACKDMGLEGVGAALNIAAALP
jgi:hypothetical protein